MRALFCAVLLQITALCGYGQGFSIHGSVIDGLTGQPLNQVRLHLYQWNENEPLLLATEAVAPLTPDRAGSFRFANLAPGQYSLQAELAQAVIFYGEPDQFGKHIVAVGPGKVDSEIVFRVLPRLTLTGVVHDESGVPVRDALVSVFAWKAEPAHPRIASGKAITDDLGEYRIENLEPGDYTACVNPSEWPPHAVYPVARGEAAYLGPGQYATYKGTCEQSVSPAEPNLHLGRSDHVDFAMGVAQRPSAAGDGQGLDAGLKEGASVEGVVLDAQSSLPVSGARVTATVSPQAVWPATAELAVLTGEDGRYRFTGLPVGGFDIRAGKPGYSEDRVFTTLLPNYKRLSVPAMRLTKNARVTVFVRDREGHPISGAQVVVIEPEAQAGGGPGGMTGSDGAFRAALAPGPYVAHVIGVGHYSLLRARGQTIEPTRSQTADVLLGESTVVEVQVTPIRGRVISGRVTGTPLIAISITPYPKPNSWGSSETTGVVKVDRMSGQFFITGVAPGSYEIVAQTGQPFITFLTKHVVVADADLIEVSLSPTDRAQGR